VESAGGSWAIEGRKTVTVLFCDVVAFTELAARVDPEALRGVMGQFFDRATAVVETHGGLVDKFIGDEVMAVFGVPVVHEDDALRAVRAAVAMRDSVEEVERWLGADAHLQVRIGVNTGEVAVSDPSAGHNFVSGDVIAVGKRLETAAGAGEILVGETTHRLVAHAVEASRTELVELKGLAGTTTAYRLESVDLDATAIPRRNDTPVAGREHELARLHAAYAEARAGAARFALILGEPGIGKSRLARELLTGVEPESTVLIGRCPPYGEGTTFSPLREVFRLAGRDESELEGSSYEVFAATRRLLEELARDRTVVLALDDVHWAEETLLDLIEHLASRLGALPVLLLCMARPDLAERRPSWLRDAATYLSLGPLSETESGALLEALDAPVAVRDRIAEMSEGNPLFLEQLAAFAGEDSASIELAGSIRGVLHARLDRLDREERAVLERAAVAGRSFSLEAVLELTAPQAREGAIARLYDLARRGLVRPDADIPGEGFRFQHALIREVTYDSMPKAARVDLHLAMASRLEDDAAQVAVVGYHLERAHLLSRELGRPDPELGARAGRLLRRAAQETFHRSDVPATISLLERARALLSSDDRDWAELLIEIGYARIVSGDMSGAEAVLNEAIEAATRLGDRAAELHARIERQFVRMFVDSSAPADESVRLARAAVVELEGLGDELALARAWWLVSTDDVRHCRWHERTKALERALEHARRSRVGLDVVGTLSGLIADSLLHGPTPAPDAIIRIEQLVAEDQGSMLREAMSTSLAGLFAMQGRADEARRAYGEAAATYEELGLWFRRALQAFVVAQIELWSGNPAGAERELVASSGALEEFGAGNSAVTHRAFLAEVLCALDRLDEAEALAVQVGEDAPVDDLVVQVLWRSALCRVRSRRGRAGEAAELGSEALRLTEGMEFPYLRSIALTAAAEVEAGLGRAPAAQSLVGEARSINEAKGNVVEARRLEELAARIG
jgi:class 3 adenylate cyclase/tetratricopeptide (TPR) repeat protein